MIAVRYLVTVIVALMLSVPAMSVELFRYRGAAKNGGTLEYVFETDGQDVPQTVTKEKSGRDRRRFYDQLLRCPGRRT
jgi:hypothetical protein